MLSNKFYIMKKVIVLLLLSVFSFGTFAQTRQDTTKKKTEKKSKQKREPKKRDTTKRDTLKRDTTRQNPPM